MVEVVFLGSHLTHNLDVYTFLATVVRDVIVEDYSKDVNVDNTLAIRAFGALPNTLAEPTNLI